MTKPRPNKVKLPAGSLCFECAQPALHAHHVIPYSKGGTKTVPLCERCHGKVHGLAMLGHGALTKASLAAKAARGERVSRFLPYGSQLGADGKSLDPNPQEAAIIARAKQLRASGLKLREVQAIMSAEGKLNRKGKAFDLPTLHRMIAA